VQEIRVSLGDRSYPIVIGAGWLAAIGARVRAVVGSQAIRAAVVSDSRVAPLYVPVVAASLRAAEFAVAEIQIPEGEQHKNLAWLALLYDRLIEAHIERSSPIVAVGGGVVGDLAGFAAAVVRRGVDYVQVPTTLLAQVDSAVGGKTAVNHPGGKNLIGAFHQPVAVISDTTTLATLPPRELRAGLAEVIKYGLMCDAALFEWLEKHLDELLACKAEAVAHVVRRSCEIKAMIVGRDEREERGDRALLNLGHTFGHAVESATGYRKWLHGEAVGAGLVMAAAMSRELGLVSPEELVRVHTLVERAGLPTRGAGVAPESVLEHMRIDKKVLGGRLRLVLLRRIGNAFLTADYAEDALERTLQAYCG
jgi:3-dehydroquinate synthase